jgi:hypothetical protein
MRIFIFLFPHGRISGTLTVLIPSLDSLCFVRTLRVLDFNTGGAKKETRRVSWEKTSPRSRFSRAETFLDYWLIMCAVYPPPKPLSMFTTVTPGAQEFNIVSSAASPPKEAP